MKGDFDGVSKSYASSSISRRGAAKKGEKKRTSLGNCPGCSLSAHYLGTDHAGVTIVTKKEDVAYLRKVIPMSRKEARYWIAFYGNVDNAVYWLEEALRQPLLIF